MKRLLAFALCLALSLSLWAQEKISYKYTDASTLTITGKLCPGTPNPYHRVDTVQYKGFTPGENLQVRESSGLGIAFKTDSPVIRIRAQFGEIQHPVNTMGIAVKGFDIYIRKDGKWLWAGAAAKADGKETEPINLVKNLDGSMHECLLYLPLFSELNSLEIGVKEGCTLEAIPNPFRHRVGIFGSSYTHGVSTSRSGMTYPAQFSRSTGIQLLSLGCSGNCKLQPYFADVLADADVDAFIFDTFSNPSPEEMEQRLFPFIEKIQAAHPGIPLIFQSTIYRERRNFDTGVESSEKAKAQMADSLMKIACKKYKDVYFIHPTAANAAHETSVDGIHPGDYGYTIWEQSVEKKILRILKKYGIR